MGSKTFTGLDYVALALFLVVLTIVSRTHRSRRRRGLLLPPGPPRLPIIGNMFDVPSISAWESYKCMSRRYGDIISFEVPGYTIIVINSLRIARDLLDKRGQTWSDRVYFPLLKLMELSDWALSIQPHHEVHRAQRRIADSVLRPNALAQSNYRSIQQSRMNDLMMALLNNPERFMEHIDFMLASIILEYVYGYDLKSADDKFLVVSRIIIGTMNRATTPSASIINIFPSLSFLPIWFPGMGEARMIEEIKRLGREVREEPFERVVQEIHTNTAKPSLVRNYILSRTNNGDPSSLPTSDKENIVSISAFLYAAAEETTRTFLQNVILLFLLHPEVQQRAQAEIDSVVGRGKLPDHGDLELLPYLQAVCLEMLRWKPITPVGVPHTTAVDDVYERYFIPKGSMVIANAWAMLHDPLSYPDSEIFKPERFLDEYGKFRNDPDVSVGFGFGRRLCPGRFLAMEVAHITVLYMLSAFTITKAKDADGNEIPVTGEYAQDDPILCVPLPFQCAIIPRDEKAKSLIEAIYAAPDV